MKFASMILALAVFPLATTEPAFAHHTPSDPYCAPVFYCVGNGCFYDLLNDPNFSGTHPSCIGWGDYPTISFSSACNSNASILAGGDPAIWQNFIVPSGTTGTLNLAVGFATAGTPTSLSDRLQFYLRDTSETLLEYRTIYTKNSPLSCHREDLFFNKYNYAGRSLYLSVRAIYGTPGVTYHIDWIQIFADL